MPADYQSTARALAIPVSPERSPSSEFRTTRPAWSQHQSTTSARSRRSFSNSPTSWRDQVIDNAEKVHRRVMKTYRKLTPLQRILAAVALVVVATLGILFLVFNEKIFGWLEPLAKKWKKLNGGWTILWALTFMTAFPPIIGYSTCGTIAGFVYGVWEGWLILATATIVGSTCSFLVSRTVLSKYVHRIVANDKRWAALTLTLKHDGLKLLCMIRLCPLPYSLSNGAMSTFPTVHPLLYALATACVTPKLLIHVFIGSRLAAIAESGEKMPLGTKAVNWASIIGGGLIGAFTGWYIYQRTIARARELEAEERENVRQSAAGQRPSDPDADPADFPEFSDDPDEQAAATTLARDELDYFDERSHNASGEGDAAENEYRDAYTDGEEDDVFGQGDGDDEEEIIGLHRAVKSP